ncbi:MAG: SusC/RagA family TonB-linked outer membrane protein, partial [Muribaculaceae bacterium]|nr:SusC/RagA family TonB-linked outer membrane protein [Muribaculaceae bacterium]
RTASGYVYSVSDDQPVIGATVLVKGTSIGTSTDLDGNFIIKNVPANASKLVISYIGMHSQEVNIGEGLRIGLQNDSQQLDDVMVVAYGTSTKEAFTGSAAVVDASQIENSQVSNALNALSGKVAGVQINNLSGAPGSTTPTIRIRGISSLNAGNDPLVIVDGATYSGDMNNINPNDIASMTLLKDAASNALYGARGANGVIPITTKKAKRGNGTVAVDIKWGSNSRASQNYETINDPRQYYEIFYSALKNYAMNFGGYSDARAYEWANNNLTANNTYGTGYQTYTAPDGQYLIGKDGRFNPNATEGYMHTYRGQQYWMTPDNWMDAAYSNSLRQEYNVSVSNGTEKSSFYMSAGYLKNDGIIENTGYRRFTGRLTADSQIKEWLKVGGSANYANYSANSMSEEGTSNSSGNILAAATQIAPIYPLYMRDASGNIIYDGNNIMRYDYGDKAVMGWERPVFTNSNAFSSNMLDTDRYQGNAFDASGFVEVRFLNDFKFTSNNSFNLNETRSTYVTNPYYGSYASSNGITSKYHERTHSCTFQQLLEWNHSFGLHHVSVLLGHENYIRKYAYLFATRSNMFDPNNSELSGAVTSGDSNSYTTEYNNEGWLGRAQYDYNEKYFGSVSVRRDASSRFHPDHRWGTFWSLGGAWILSKESWFTAPWVDLLKIKASYGEQGNDNINNYLYTNTYNIVNGSGSPAATPATLGNPNISWEKNGNFNAGVEFKFFNSRLGGSIEGFYRKTSDMLSWFTLPPSFGYTGYWD